MSDKLGANKIFFGFFNAKYSLQKLQGKIFFTTVKMTLIVRMTKMMIEMMIEMMIIEITR